MRRPSKPMTRVTAEQLMGDTTDVDSLLSKAYHIIQREIHNLMVESTGGKLHKDSAQALINYTKLLAQIKIDQDAVLDSLTTDELNEALAKSNTESPK